MLILYRIAVEAYGLIIKLISPWNVKARKFVKGRQGLVKRLHQDLQLNQDPIVWVHAASLGEFEQGRPIIESVKQQHPNMRVLLTFFSPSGFEVRKNYAQADWVYYLPLDSPSRARNFIQVVNPVLVIFVKYEIWYYFLKTLVDKHISTIIVSAIFRKNQIFLHWSGRFFRPVLKKINHYFVQDEASQKLISSLSTQVSVAGDTRFDRVIAIAEQAQSYSVVEAFLGGKQCFMIGSSWPSDMEKLYPFIRNFSEHFKFVIAPHNINEEELIEIEKHIPQSVRYSDPQKIKDAHAMIIDNIGMLSSLYQYADFTFIGGGFRGALHNTLEAAVFGVPVFFGQHERNQKFKEAIDLLEEGAAFAIEDTESLNTHVQKLVNDNAYYTQVCQKAKTYVFNKKGATDLIMKKVNELL